MKTVDPSCRNAFFRLTTLRLLLPKITKTALSFEFASNCSGFIRLLSRCVLFSHSYFA